MNGYEFSFFVPGYPITGGSKTAYVIHRKGCPAGRRYNKGPCICTPRATVFDAAGERNRQWRHTIAKYGIEALKENGITLIQTPMEVYFIFFMPRPKSHYGKMGILKKSAPSYHCHKPDAIKLARAAEDALNKVVWRDDSLSVAVSSRKEYSDRNITPGALIRIVILPHENTRPPVELSAHGPLLHGFGQHLHD